MSETDSSKRRMNRKRNGKFARGSQEGLLAKVTKDLKAIGDEAPQTLEIISRQRQSGLSDQEVGNQIIEFFQMISTNVNEVTNRGYRQIEEIKYDWYNREQTLIYWRDLRQRTLTELTSNIERYVGQEVGQMEGSILHLIREGSLNFRKEIEVYLKDVESTFAKLK